ncbi:AAA domain-containing protein [Mycoplasma sp. 6243]|uniref:AAA domain-containing protein n=1 Tax=Mycoplasma sp. 6243 TaxID=3440865 RepID=UPI003EBED36F
MNSNDINQYINYLNGVFKNIDNYNLEVINLDLLSSKKKLEKVLLNNDWNDLKTGGPLVSTVVFIVKLKDSYIKENKIDRFNSICLFTKLKKLESIKDLYFELSRIEFLDLSLEKEYQNISNLCIQLINIKYEENYFRIYNTLKENHKIRNIILEKSSELMWTKNTKTENGLKLRNSLDFLISFHIFNKESDKKTYSYPVLKFKDRRVDNINTYHKYWCLVSRDNKKEKLVSGKNISIFAENDYDDKYEFTNKNENDVDKTEYIKSKLNSFIKSSNESINMLTHQNQNLTNEINEKEKEKKQSEKHKQDLQQQISNFNNKINEVSNQIKEIKKIKEQSWEDDYDVDNYKDKINYLNNEKLLLEQKIKKIDVELKNISENIRISNTKLSDIRTLIKSNKESIEKEEKKVKYIEKLIADKFFKIYKIIETELKIKKDTKSESIENINIKSINDSEHSLLNIKDLFNSNHYYLSDKDEGLVIKYRRFYNSLKNFSDGMYRNPYLAKSVEEPNFFQVNIPANFEINSQIALNLNQKQEESVKKALNSSSISYIQGPPGTGKTQTICAIIEHVVNENKKNCLIMSSTHEAINNALDRLYEINKKNPNFIYFKLLRREDIDYSNPEILENEKFSDKAMLKNFTSSLFNNLITEKKNFQPFLNWYKDNKEENLLKYIDIKLSVEYLESNKDKAPDLYLKITQHTKDEVMKITLSPYKETIDYDILHKILDFTIKTNHEYKGFEENKYFQQFKNVASKSQIRLVEFWNLDDILKKTQTQIQDKWSIYFDKMKNYYADKSNNSIDDIKNFARKAFDADLINVIGMTTSARQEISIFNDSDNSKRLFIDYPIYFQILDEVSKSTTLEVINSILMANKVTLVGDYRQLPPNVELTENLNDKKLNQYGESDKGILDNWWNWLKLQNSSKWPATEEFWNNLKKELEFPFFKEHALQIKRRYNNHSPYSFLKTQHRFATEIMNIVNFVYDHDEKLEMPSIYQSHEFINYNLKTNQNNNFNHHFNIVDSTHYSTDFMKFLSLNSEHSEKNKIINALSNLSYTADQKSSMFKNKEYNGRINEYNAYIIIKILHNLFKNNNINSNQIGVICMNRDQSNVVRSFIKEYSHIKALKNIKVDTVDNFQGREKDIVIVDLIRAQNSFDENGFVSLNTRNYDFYKKIERLNVAVSRAKDKLILVGAFRKPLNDIVSEIDLPTGSKFESIIRKWYDEASSKGAIVNYDEEQFNED